MDIKYKHIEAAREVRLWITTIIVPAAIIAGTIDNRYPDLKYQIADKIKERKTKIVNRFKRN